MRTATIINRIKQAQRQVAVAFAPAFINVVPMHNDITPSSALLEIKVTI